MTDPGSLGSPGSPASQDPTQGPGSGPGSGPARVLAYTAHPEDTHLSLRIECPRCETEWGWARDTRESHDRLTALAADHNHATHEPPQACEDPACCTACGGTGSGMDSAVPGGACWDCYGTGHPHPQPQPQPQPDTREAPAPADTLAAWLPLLDVPVRIWFCPVREHRDRRNDRGGPVVTVTWDGPVASCTAPGCGRTSANVRTAACDNWIEHADGTATACTGLLRFGPDDTQAACHACGAWCGRLVANYLPSPGSADE